MDILFLKEMIEREEEAFRSGTNAAALMEAAGQALAERILALYPRAPVYLILVGKGNNGGDGLVVARHLAHVGRQIEVVLAAPENELGELPRAQLAQLHAHFPELNIAVWHDDLEFPSSDGVVIDALLGIQASGPLRGLIAQIVAKTNAARAARFFRTVALDLPTGLAAYENTEPPEHRDAAIVADITIAVGFAKTVLVHEALAGWVGRLEVVAWKLDLPQTASLQALVPAELAGLLPRRNALSYKGHFGKLAIVAGGVGFTGAPVLCAQAAIAMGAGLTSIVTHRNANSMVAAHAPPEAMVSSWPPAGDPNTVVTNATAIVIGPGLGANAENMRMLRAVLAVGCPVVIDADGLNTLAQNLDLLAQATGPVLLTPHIGEMARLIGRKFSHDERETIAREFVDRRNVTLILKGTRTLITAPRQLLYINTTGNPGLSTGGSGDTLSGILGALLAQGLSTLDAARLGVWLHGHAADLLLAERGCEEGITPTQLSAHLGAALVSLRAQAIPPPGLLDRCCAGQ